MVRSGGAIRGANKGNSARAHTAGGFLGNTLKMGSETTNSTPTTMEEMNQVNGSYCELIDMANNKYLRNMDDIFNSDDEEDDEGGT